MCREDSCTLTASFGDPLDGISLYCKQHKKPGHSDVRHDKCIKCHYFTTHREGQICLSCDTKKKREKTREMVVKEFLEEDIDAPFIHDKRLVEQLADSGRSWCGSYQPDFLFDCGTHRLVVECDEHQHKGYKYSKTGDRAPDDQRHGESEYEQCEVPRMLNITNWLGMRTVFIRYNPDKYRVNGRLQDISRTERHKLLKERIEYYIKHFPDENGVGMWVEFLYYDDRHLHCDFYDYREHLGFTM